MFSCRMIISLPHAYFCRLSTCLGFLNPNQNALDFQVQVHVYFHFWNEINMALFYAINVEKKSLQDVVLLKKRQHLGKEIMIIFWRKPAKNGRSIYFLLWCYLGCFHIETFQVRFTKLYWMSSCRWWIWLAMWREK